MQNLFKRDGCTNMFHACGFGPWIYKLLSAHAKYKITNEAPLAEVQKAFRRWNR